MPGTLYIVATPIGNLEDITYRAVRVLGEVEAIYCEDTRQTRKLLDRYGLSTALVSCHEHNEKARAAGLDAHLDRGGAVALVSDAGTPLLSDPGYRMVEMAIRAGHRVVPIPGPAAFVTALCASGLPAESFQFRGFLPPKPGERRRTIDALRDVVDTVIFYEAPHRILETLADLVAALGPARPVVVARELTKLHEEFVRGGAAEVLAVFEERGVPRGEITLLIGRPSEVREAASPEDLRAEVEGLERGGMARKDAIKHVARRRGLGKREVYALFAVD